MNDGHNKGRGRSLMALSFILMTTSVNAAEVAGAVLALRGEVTAQQGNEKRALERLSPVYSGDTLNTGEGQVQLRFQDGALLTLYSDTRFVVDEYHYDAGKKSTGKNDRAHFSLLTGLLHSLSGGMGKDNFKLNTRLANLGVRGTEFQVRVEKELLVSVYQGRVLISNQAGVLELRAGHSARVTDRLGVPQSNPRRLDLITKRGRKGGKPGEPLLQPSRSPPPLPPPGGPISGGAGKIGGTGGISSGPGGRPPPIRTRQLQNNLLPPPPPQ